MRSGAHNINTHHRIDPEGQVVAGLIIHGTYSSAQSEAQSPELLCQREVTFIYFPQPRFTLEWHVNVHGTVFVLASSYAFANLQIAPLCWKTKRDTNRTTTKIVASQGTGVAAAVPAVGNVSKIWRERSSHKNFVAAWGRPCRLAAIKCNVAGHQEAMAAHYWYT